MCVGLYLHCEMLNEHLKVHTVNELSTMRASSYKLQCNITFLDSVASNKYARKNCTLGQTCDKAAEHWLVKYHLLLNSINIHQIYRQMNQS